MEMNRFLIALFVIFYSGTSMAAAAMVQNVSGDVKVMLGTAPALPVSQNQALENGMTVMTGENGRVVMKFEDGELVALNTNASFKIDQYHFEPSSPEKNSIVFSLLKGAMRAVTGLIGKSNSNGFALHTPTATIGIRGTDFMAATGSLYLQVLNGMVSATNSVGAATFTVGQTGFVASLSAVPMTIAATQLPLSVATSFSQLSSMTLTGAGALGGGSGGGVAGTGTAATGAGVGELSTAGVVGSAAAIGAAAAIISGKNSAIGTTTVTQ
jgi:hypothetical protein